MRAALRAQAENPDTPIKMMIPVVRSTAHFIWMQKMMLKGNQEKLGFNMEDLSAALTDPALAGVPKGYIGNTVMATGEGGMHLRPSTNPTYNTDFTAEYLGSLGQKLLIG